MLSHDLLLTDFCDADDVRFEIADFPGCVLAEQVWWWGGGVKREKTLGHGFDHVPSGSMLRLMPPGRVNKKFRLQRLFDYVCNGLFNYCLAECSHIVSYLRESHPAPFVGFRIVYN